MWGILITGEDDRVSMIGEIIKNEGERIHSPCEGSFYIADGDTFYGILRKLKEQLSLIDFDVNIITIYDDDRDAFQCQEEFPYHCKLVQWFPDIYNTPISSL